MLHGRLVRIGKDLFFFSFSFSFLIEKANELHIHIQRLIMFVGSWEVYPTTAANSPTLQASTRVSSQQVLRWSGASMR